MEVDKLMGTRKPILVIIKTDVTPEMEQDFNRWYDEEHIPGLLKVPGIKSARRGINSGAGQKYIAVYEHESAEVQHSQAYKDVLGTDWARKIRPHLKNFSRETYEIL
jgi:hypothetical protein